jgi:hypothetical protein
VFANCILQSTVMLDELEETPKTRNSEEGKSHTERNVTFFAELKPDHRRSCQPASTWWIPTSRSLGPGLHLRQETMVSREMVQDRCQGPIEIDAGIFGA